MPTIPHARWGHQNILWGGEDRVSVRETARELQITEIGHCPMPPPQAKSQGRGINPVGILGNLNNGDVCLIFQEMSQKMTRSSIPPHP